MTIETVLFFDTETTGLPKFELPSEDPSQPHITQIAAELCVEETGETLAAINLLIYPDGWAIPDDVAALTGITTARAQAYGYPIDAALPMFMTMWEMATKHRVAHNETFDMRMIRIELMRSGLSETADIWKAGPAFCTCSSNTKTCNLPPTPKMVAAGRKGPKPPNLSEAFEFFTGQKLEGAHNASVDVWACKAIYYAMKERAAITA